MKYHALLPLLLALASTAFGSGCSTTPSPRGVDYGQVENSSGCVCPPPFPCDEARCFCRGIHHGKYADEVELRCGDSFITYVEPPQAPVTTTRGSQ